MAAPTENDEVSTLLASIVALLIDEREARIRNDPNAVKTELLLARAGLRTSTIAQLIGKQHDAVRKSISRARKNKTEVTDDA